MPSADQFLEALKLSPEGSRISAEIAAARMAERKMIADELDALGKAIEESFPKLTSAADKALVEYRKVEKQLAEARAKVGAANAAKTNASLAYTAQRADLERQLADTASPLLKDFISWARDEITLARKAFVSRHWNDKNLITGAVTPRTENNAASIAARISALHAAIEAAETMKLIPDQSRLPETLERLRADLPTIQEI